MPFLKGIYFPNMSTNKFNAGLILKHPKFPKNWLKLAPNKKTPTIGLESV
jgi:hypothetical protein